MYLTVNQISINKQKLKLGLKRVSISNVSTIKGGSNSDLSACIYCVDTGISSQNIGDCEETANCETQGGYVCGETIGLNCGFRTYEFHNCDTYSQNRYC